MRVIAGSHRGRRLAVPSGRGVRPTTDRMRERLFSILNHHRYPPLVGATVLDGFAGTGALGIEALSRGAHHAVFIEKAHAPLAYLRENLAALDLKQKASIIQADARRAPPPRDLQLAGAVTIILLDPPYGQGLIPPTLAHLEAVGWIDAETVICAELGSDEALPDLPGFSVLDDRQQGAQRLLILMQS